MKLNHEIGKKKKVMALVFNLNMIPRIKNNMHWIVLISFGSSFSSLKEGVGKNPPRNITMPVKLKNYILNAYKKLIVPSASGKEFRVIGIRGSKFEA